LLLLDYENESEFLFLVDTKIGNNNKKFIFFCYFYAHFFGILERTALNYPEMDESKKLLMYLINAYKFET
jgi:hypothetical protein